MVQDPSRILIVLPTWVGDFVMATPTLRAIRNRFSQAHIALLANRNLVELIRGGDWMNEVIVWDKGKGGGECVFRTSLRLRSQRFDAALLLSNSFRSAALVRLAGIPRRIGYSRDGRGWLLTDRLHAPRANGQFVPYPMVDYYGALAEHCGGPKPGDDLELFTTPDADAGVETRLQQLRLAGHGMLVVIAPGASFGASKCWLPERFAELADRLTDEINAAVLITCGPGEEPIARAIGGHMKRKGFVLDSPGLSLAELKSLVRRCQLLVCNDIGPRHFAKAFGVPVVTIFGPTHPRWTDTSYPLERKVRIDVDCGPCQQKVCPLGHLKCMTGVSADSVYLAARELLKLVPVPRRSDGLPLDQFASPSS